MKFYLLNEIKVPYEVSLEESYKLYDNPDMKIVKQDKLENGLFVSTVFTGMDWEIDSEPLLWETMVFNDLDETMIEEYKEKYKSYEDAVKGHERILELVKNVEKISH